MKIRLAWVGVVVACGGTHPIISSNVPPSSTVPASPWMNILKQGAAWQMEAPDHPTITITVASVTTANGVTTAQLAFAIDGKPTELMVPSTIVLDTNGVRVGDLQYPADGKPVNYPDGRYVKTTRDGEICYGAGPSDDAGECADVCDANLCIDATGISGGLGTWWPDYELYTRKNSKARTIAPHY